MADTLSPTGSRDRLPAREMHAAAWLVRVGDRSRHDGVVSRPLVASGDGRFLVTLREEGRAPSTLLCREKAVVFEGHLFERSELAERLGLAPSLAPSDAELVVRAYERWGEGLAAHLKGVYSFCLWDSRRARLVAARDRLGIYPLFYCRHAGALFLSPVIDAFAAAPGPGLDVDRGVLAGLLARQHPELEETFYRGVKRVPPGHYLTGDGFRQPRTERYWDLPAVGEGAEWVDEEELYRFGELLDQAVARALDIGPAAIFLSGGLDSVSVAGAAAQRAGLLGQPSPLALSLLFPGTVSEETTQRGVAEMLGLDQRFIPLHEAVGPNGLVSAALRTSATAAAPLQNVWHPAYRTLACDAKAEGRRVILTGGGGDEWLTVSPVIAADYIRSFDLPHLFSYVSAVRRSLHLPTAPLLRNVLWRNGLGKLLRYEKERLVRRHVPGVRTARLRSSLDARLSRLPGWLAPDPAVARTLARRIENRFWQRAAIPSEVGPGGFYFSDRNSSLDHPLLAVDAEEVYSAGREMDVLQFDIYWDADLVEFLNRVPPHLLNSGGRTKGLVRGEVAKRFPGLGFDRQKKLVSRDFFCSLLLDEGGPAWQALEGASALADLGLVEPRSVQEFVSSVLTERDERHVDDVWRLMSLESWVRPRV
ncbi:MAG TPA: asparagine synthase-related protein [Trueperaceae bacterium]